MTCTSDHNSYKRGCRCAECTAANTAFVSAARRAKGILPRDVPISYKGVTYPTQTEAARAIGVCSRTINSHLNRYGDLSKLRVRA